MKIGHWIDIGKYLVDISKVTLGVAVISPIFGSSNFVVSNRLIVGAAVAVIVLLAGVYMKNLKQ